MIINHNIAALNTYRQMSANQAQGQNNISKLSSGLRINKAGDDAAGLAISEKMRAQVRGLDQASRNAQDGISMLQTAEGGLNEVHSILQRMRELADQSANGTNTADDRNAMQTEVNQLKQEIDRIGNTTEFNTQKLLNGSQKSAAGASVGQNTTVGTNIGVGKLAAAVILATAANSLTADLSLVASSSFTAEDITLDGTTIHVNWQNLSTADRNTIVAGTNTTNATAMAAAKDVVVNTINAAIDEAGGKVAHISGWVDSATKALVIQSGSTGTDSEIKTTAGILNTLLVTSANVKGTNEYNGTTITAADTFYANINGIQLNVTVGAVISAGSSMTADATVLETAINAAIDAYNTDAGATNTGDPGRIDHVQVNASKDGRFEIVSESGPISLADKDGKTTVSDLGLAKAQTDSSGNGGMTFQIGANKGQTMTVGINDMRSAAMNIAGIDISSTAGASNALTTLDSAIKNVSAERAKLGAFQNRLEHTINNLGTSSENLTSAESRIRDVDMAKEMMEFTKNNVLTQAAQAMLAQANQQPQQVLQLLR